MKSYLLSEQKPDQGFVIANNKYPTLACKQDDPIFRKSYHKVQLCCFIFLCNTLGCHGVFWERAQIGYQQKSL